MKRKWLLICTVVLILSALTISVQAQSGDVVISLSVSEFMEDQFDSVITQFELEHPGVQIHVVNSNGPVFDGETYDEMLDSVEAYVSTADVLAIDSQSLNSEITRAGYFLDLAPLINSDATFNTDDFYESVWQSFHWDGGIWAVPVAVDATLLFYDPEAFDAANLAYPNENWTIHDLDYASRALAEYGADGSIVSPGLSTFGGNVEDLFISAVGQPVYDMNTFPVTPQFTNPQLETVLDVWAQMQADGVAGFFGGGNTADLPSLQLSRSLFQSFGRGLGGNNSNSVILEPSLLPGGRSGLILDGYAISSGTRHPQEAYELVKFLSNSPEVANVMNGVIPARHSLNGVEPTNSNDGPGPRFIGPAIDPELEATVLQAIDVALPASEMLYAEYLIQVVAQIQSGIDARTALDEIEQTINENLALADERKTSISVVVDTPPTTVELAAGEVRLNFGVSSFISPLPNQDAWEQAAGDFATNDPVVGQVIIDTALPIDVNELTETYDCFYMETNIVQSADLSLLRSIDPLLDSDPSFDINDMVGNVMQQVQSNGQTWAMPLFVQPAAMRYDSELFANAGAYTPDGGWTVSEFEDALQMLKFYLGDEQFPYQPSGFDNSHWLMLIAAYGGIPIDYRTDPATINFTDPATVEAIRNVLDLAKNGYIEYSEISGGGNFTIIIGGGDDDTRALYSEVINAFTVNGLRGFGRGGGGGSGRGRGGQNQNQNTQTNSDILVTFPSGSQYNAVSYDLAAAYISANTPYMDACYRFISEIAQNPDLMTVMPARRSVINSFELASSQGEDNVAFYNALDAIMQQSNTISFPTTQIGGGRIGAISQIFDTYWLNRAFDRYVLEDADLDTELAEAQLYTSGFKECTAALPAFDPAIEEPRAYFQQISACASNIDPTASFGFGGGGGN